MENNQSVEEMAQKVKLAKKLAIQKRLKSVLNVVGDTLVNLWCRWQDEKEYEDFNDYVTEMKKVSKDIEGFKILKGNKRPFGFDFKLDEYKDTYTFKLYVNSKDMGIKAIS